MQPKGIMVTIRIGGEELLFSGLDTPCCMQSVTVEVSPSHPLIQLAHVIPWQALADTVLPDPKRTTAKGKWWLGRQLTLRIHLGVFLLQQLYTLTDRQVERAIKDNAAYQLFCGRGLVDPWHAPGHTKIEAFRSRLSPETQRQVANAVAVWATQLGFADPSAMDIDSTVQEANIAYPSDAHLMVKMTFLVHKVWMYMKQYFGQNLGCLIGNDPIVTKCFVIRAGFLQTLPVG
jgi:transposase, IS5 family